MNKASISFCQLSLFSEWALLSINTDTHMVVAATRTTIRTRTTTSWRRARRRRRSRQERSTCSRWRPGPRCRASEWAGRRGRALRRPAHPRPRANRAATSAPANDTTRPPSRRSATRRTRTPRRGPRTPAGAEVKSTRAPCWANRSPRRRARRRASATPLPLTARATRRPARAIGDASAQDAHTDTDTTRTSTCAPPSSTCSETWSNRSASSSPLSSLRSTYAHQRLFCSFSTLEAHDLDVRVYQLAACNKGGSLLWSLAFARTECTATYVSLYTRTSPYHTQVNKSFFTIMNTVYVL